MRWRGAVVVPCTATYRAFFGVMPPWRQRKQQRAINKKEKLQSTAADGIIALLSRVSLVSYALYVTDSQSWGVEAKWWRARPNLVQRGRRWPPPSQCDKL